MYGVSKLNIGLIMNLVAVRKPCMLSLKVEDAITLGGATGCGMEVGL